MITLAELARQYQSSLLNTYQSQITSAHSSALQSLMDCRTLACGEMKYFCTPCAEQQYYYHSCGHRSCPRCQHRHNGQWLARQQQKLLPVNYFMVTLTLPYALRDFVWQHQRIAYTILFDAAVDTLNTFSKNDKHLKGPLGITGVLHTHSRRLEFHPHVHLIVPGGSFHKGRSCWQAKPSKYLFNEFALAKVFRAKFLAALHKAGLKCPRNPKKWVAQCQQVGCGEPALKYLARYLYRGVINENNIIHHQQGQLSFGYKDAKTKTWKIRTEPAVKFLWLVLQHVLPKGFRRTRDYGFLHGNAKKTLQRLQLSLKVAVSHFLPPKKQQRLCPSCGDVMKFILFSMRPIQGRFGVT